ncbi:hypothetical protein FKM82_024176 [Ascaphus truei]
MHILINVFFMCAVQWLCAILEPVIRDVQSFCSIFSTMHNFHLILWETFWKYFFHFANICYIDLDLKYGYGGWGPI